MGRRQRPEPGGNPWVSAGIGALGVALVVGLGEQLVTRDPGGAWQSALLWAVAAFAFLAWTGQRRQRRRR